MTSPPKKEAALRHTAPIETNSLDADNPRLFTSITRREDNPFIGSTPQARIRAETAGGAVEGNAPPE